MDAVAPLVQVLVGLVGLVEGAFTRRTDLERESGRVDRFPLGLVSERGRIRALKR